MSAYLERDVRELDRLHDTLIKSCEASELIFGEIRHSPFIEASKRLFELARERVELAHDIKAWNDTDGLTIGTPLQWWFNHAKRSKKTLHWIDENGQKHPCCTISDLLDSILHIRTPQ